MDIWLLIIIFMLACFIGYFIVWSVTPALHSPLMSVSNAISGIIIIGALISLQHTDSTTEKFLLYTSCFLASINIFGGFTVTQRMLEMFKSKDKK